jgi:hypothetical protein
MAEKREPASGVTVRMYRQGHGDCFLLSFPRLRGDVPVYVLIDCGLKPGSQEFVHGRPIGDVVDDIAEVTGEYLDLVILTHEHQDHLNGIWKKNDPYFGRFSIGRAWLGWTESPDDPLAIELRRRYKDALLGVAAARKRLALNMDRNDLTVRRLDDLLRLELGEDEDDEPLTSEALLGLAGKPENSVNKQAIKLIRDKASKGVSYLCPGDGPLEIPGTGVRVYVFGPPRDLELLRDENPQGSEAFPSDSAHAFTFNAAASESAHSAPPFRERYGMSLKEARDDPFFRVHYGFARQGEDDADKREARDNAPWRRIDDDWLYTAETLALVLNRGINNTSLVLAFELPESKKVLFFVGDAQRGNWISWKDLAWQDGERTVTARDLLERTVLYKVGHHGSHNATLNGRADDPHPNLGWMADGPAAYEFTAMITAVNRWATTQNNPPWHHPLASIKRALNEKAQGRVLQTDVDRPRRPASVSETSWRAFLARCDFNPLYFDYTIEDA